MLSHAAVLHQFRRETALTLERANAAVALARRHGFGFWEAFASILAGWALAKQGQGDIRQIRRGIAGYEGAGAELERPLWLALLAETCGELGLIDEGIAAVTEGLGVAQKNGIPFYDAELRRLKGVLLLSRPHPDEQQAEAYFREALTISRRQQAKSLELRAATSLHRLWQRQGRGTESLRMLGEIYGGFTEGFDTADLQAANTLLAASA